jgi:hypothetical protein
MSILKMLHEHIKRSTLTNMFLSILVGCNTIIANVKLPFIVFLDFIDIFYEFGYLRRMCALNGNEAVYKG